MRRRAVSSSARTGAGRNSDALFVALRHRPVHDGGDLLAAEHADDLIDFGHLFEQDVALPLGHAAGDDHRPDLARLLQCEHLADDGERFLPGRLDEAAGVDDDHVGPVGVRLKGVAVLGELAEHPLGIDGVLRAAQRNEGVVALGFRFQGNG